MSSLLQSAQQKRAPRDCRVYERQPCDIPARCHPASLLDMKEAGWDGAITDISQGGVRLSLSRRFERGTALALELPGDDAREPTVVFVKVVHIKSGQAGTWLLGCQFISELSSDEIQRLLQSEHHVLSTEEEIEVAELANADDNVVYLEVIDEDGSVEYVELIAEDEHIDVAAVVEEIKDAEPIEIDDDENSTAVMEVTDVSLARKKKKIPPA